jgi:hypothetical protein
MTTNYMRGETMNQLLTPLQFLDELKRFTSHRASWEHMKLIMNSLSDEEIYPYIEAANVLIQMMLD